jgi:PAS domain S-box-containing protein
MIFWARIAMSSQPARLLIVDDNTINSKLLSRLLAKQGYAISLAEGAQGLLERVRRDAVDLVLLDIDMPEISGLDGLRMLREVYSAIELPVIMVTAKDQSEDIVRALELGANDYLTKPIDFSVTLARIQTQLSLKRAEEALRESEERYALAARGANDGLWDWNLRADTLYLSRRWKAMLGYQENEIGEKPEEWFSRIHEVDRERVLGEIRAHQQGAAPLFESEHRMLHKDGSFRWMLSRGVAICDASGKPARMAG